MKSIVFGEIIMKKFRNKMKKRSNGGRTKSLSKSLLIQSYLEKLL